MEKSRAAWFVGRTSSAIMLLFLLLVLPVINQCLANAASIDSGEAAGKYQGENVQDRTKGIKLEPSNQETRGGKVKMVLCKDKCVSGCKAYHLPGTTTNSEEGEADVSSLSAHAKHQFSHK